MKQAIILSLSISKFAMSDITKAGCSSESQSYDNSGEVMQSKIYKCAGKFSGGVYGNDAASLCNTGFHVCNSATEMMNMGFTREMCDSLPQKGEFWATKETSAGSCACYSYQWQSQEDYEWDNWKETTPKTGVFGCAKETLMCKNQPCGDGTYINSEGNEFALNAAIGKYGEKKENAHWSTMGKSGDKDCYKNGANCAALDDPSGGGVLCCTDDVNKIITASPTTSPTVKVETEAQEEATSSSAFIFIIIIFVICCAVSGCN